MSNLEKEIEEQAKILDRFDDEDRKKIQKVVKIIDNINSTGGRIFLFGSGSSLNACYYGRELFSRDNDIVLEVFPAGEVENHANDINSNDLVILVSQSGESADIINAKKSVETIKTVIITNNINSTLAKGAEIVIGQKAREEKAVPATKTYFASLLIFTMLSEALKGRIKIVEVDNILAKEPKNLWVEDIIDKKIYILGKGLAWPQAIESELKFKEIAKIDAEGYELSEFMHGPIQMLDEGSAVIIFCSKVCDELNGEMISKIKKKKAKIIAIANCECREADRVIQIESEDYYELKSIVTIQKLAIELAKEKGNSLDSGVEKVVK